MKDLRHRLANWRELAYTNIGERGWIPVGAMVLGVTDMAWPGAWEGYVESERQLMRLPDEEAVIAWCAERFGVDGIGFNEASDFEFPEPDNALFADSRPDPR